MTLKSPAPTLRLLSEKIIVITVLAWCSGCIVNFKSDDGPDAGQPCTATDALATDGSSRDASIPKLTDYCGDGEKNGSEDCDSSDLGQQTCESLGYEGGQLGCRADCALDVSGCYNILADDTFADLRAGTIEDSGAKLFVSADGRLQLLDRRDLDRNGYIDLVFSNWVGVATDTYASYIYWGAASGFSAQNRAELPTLVSGANSIADLNTDGYPDVVVSNIGDGSTHMVDSYIYWGTASGFSAQNRTTLPTIGGYGSSVADLDSDGFLDVVFSNFSDDSTCQINSYIYWGASTGFSPQDRTELPTMCSYGNSVADLDSDGFLDLVFNNFSNDTTHLLSSYIYWGTASGFSAQNRTALPTMGAIENSVADLDSDGFLDVVFSNYRDDSTYLVDSYIYWGTASGFSPQNRTALPTIGATGVSAADLNGDGMLDLVFANHANDTTHLVNSYIYWGTASGFSAQNRTELPTQGTWGNLVADLDRNGFLDIVFSNHTDNTSNSISSYVYWGAASGFSAQNRTDLPTMGADQSTAADLGSVASRIPSERFVSRPLDAGAGSNPVFTTLSWQGAMPSGTSVKLQLRSAESESALASAPWKGPTSPWDHYTADLATIHPDHHGHRFIQYRATLTGDYRDTPVVDRVEIRWYEAVP